MQLLPSLLTPPPALQTFSITRPRRLGFGQQQRRAPATILSHAITTYRHVHILPPIRPHSHHTAVAGPSLKGQMPARTRPSAVRQLRHLPPHVDISLPTDTVPSVTAKCAPPARLIYTARTGPHREQTWRLLQQTCHISGVLCKCGLPGRHSSSAHPAQSSGTCHALRASCYVV